MSKTPTLRYWSKMKSRIASGANHSPIYGEIDICDEWSSFESFYRDMGDRPEGCTLDRINNKKGYSKENCRWATQKEQCRNRSTNVMISFLGKTMCVHDWAKELGLNRSTIRGRMVKGLPISEVLKVK